MSLFFSAFIFIFLAALPGRTTFLMLLMAARGHPWLVFCGAALAFALQSIISVALGNLFSFFPQWVIHLLAGTLFLYFAVHLWRESKTSITAPRNSGSWRSAFSIIFAAEWGDVSQVAIATFSARHTEKLPIFLSSVLALWLIAGVSVFLGAHVAKTFSATRIQRFAAVGFGLTGIYLLVQSLNR